MLVGQPEPGKGTSKALIVAFHFPPHAGSSGYLRVLKFCCHLPKSGWLPVVLTASPRAYEKLDPSQEAQIPAQVPVIRAFALDTQRHLSLRGRYLRWLALPDRWVSWCLGAVLAGLCAIRKEKIDVILTTFPIASAVLLGLILHRLTGKPWVVDFRDSMTEDEYPRDPLTRRVCRWIEKHAVRHAARLIFTAPSTIQMYRKRYPWLPLEKCVLIRNGYDEEDFHGLVAREPANAANGRPLRLLHLGLLYPEERNPEPFFRALARLKSEGRVSATTLQLDFRASGYESHYTPLLGQLGLDDVVHLLPALPYRQALQEAAEADALLLFQAACCDHQIPAKAYEYLRLGKPILALTSHTGDTAALLRESGGATIVDLDSESAIYQAFPDFLNALRNGNYPLANPHRIRCYGREQQATELACSLNQVKSEKGSGLPEPLSHAAR